MNIKRQIIAQLHLIEQQQDVKILYAIESGSRAWGFASKDSDWDVRFFYIHKPEWYLSIDDKKDSIDYITEDDIDLSGWELRKTLRLFRKSNPPLLEWLSSPIIYLEEYNAAKLMRKLTTQYFNPKSCINHYFHMAVGNYREYLRDDIVNAKKYFYVLRPILACQWIENNNSMAPMEFDKLLTTQITNKKLRNAIEGLLKRKRAGAELDSAPRIQIINDYLEEHIAYLEEQIKKYNSTERPDIKKLDQLFRDTLKEAWD